MSEIWTPLPEGTTGKDKLVREPLIPISLSQNETMADYAKSGKWFSYLPHLCWFSRPADPLADFLPRRPDLGVRVYVSPKPLFDAVTPNSRMHWKHAALWSPDESWEVVHAHMTASVLVDCGRQFFTTVLQATIPDNALLGRVSTLPDDPRVPVTIFGVQHELYGYTAVYDKQSWQPPILKWDSRRNT